MRRTFLLLLTTMSLLATGMVAGFAVGGSGVVDPPPRIAFVANGINPADALAAGAIAGQLGAPLFTTGPAALDPSAAAGVAAYEPELVLVLGGPVAIADAVLTELSTATGLAITTADNPQDGIARVAGENRFATAAAVAALLAAYDPAFLPVDATALGAIDSDTLDGLDSTDFARADVACTDGQAVTGIDDTGQPVCATVTGEQGPAGPRGEPGPAGPRGEQGDPGPGAFATVEIVTIDYVIFVQSGSTVTAEAFCPDGKHAIGGGATVANVDLTMHQSYPQGDSWFVTYRNDSDVAVNSSMEMYGVCTDLGRVTDVEVFSNDFDPDPTISVGDTIRWTNSGGTHNVVADDDSFTNGAPSSAAWTYERTFDTPGVYAYYCSQHGAAGGVGMSGVITVES